MYESVMLFECKLIIDITSFRYSANANNLLLFLSNVCTENQSFMLKFIDQRKFKIEKKIISLNSRL